MANHPRGHKPQVNCKACHAAPDGACEKRCSGTSRRTGERCGRHPDRKRYPNGRCKFHGGAAARGPAVGSWKHGLYSKHLPLAIAQEIDALEKNPRVLDLKHIGARFYVLQSWIEKKVGEADPTDDQIEALRQIQAELRRTAADYHKIALDKRFLDSLEGRDYAVQIFEIALRFVPEDQRAAANAAIKEFLDGDGTDAEPRGVETAPH